MTTPTSLAPAQTAEFRLGFTGVVSKLAPDLLRDGQYRSARNITSTQEGSISSRTGSNTLGQYSGALATLDQIRKLVVTPHTNPVSDTTNPRYVSAGAVLYRTSNYNTVPTAVTGSFLPITAGPGLWEMASYAAGSSGNPWAFLATSGLMAKDRGASPYANPLPRWGILPAYGVASWLDGGAGGLDGGAVGSPTGSSAYDWIYTYYAGDTGNQGNPSQVMVADSAIAGSAGAPAALHLRKANVTFWGSDDPQVTHVYLYRRGGTYSDGLYRLVLTHANPGLTPFQVVDNVPDLALVNAPTVEFDNAPPATSTVATPIRGTISGISGGNPGQTTITVSGISTFLLQSLTRGSLAHFTGSGVTEQCIIQQISPFTNQITVYFQYVHAIGDVIEVDAITAQPCTLAIAFADSLLVAGDPNNPQALYKSKTGRPESFPVGVDSTGAVTQINVGTPSNGILNMCEFRGNVLLLNVSGLFEATIINGSLVGPYQVASKGLLVRDAWCKTDSEVWLVATDGVYSWDGGSFTKRSESIDPLFHNEQVNGIAPINLTSTPFLRMAFQRNKVHLLYTDINGNTVRLVCEPLYGDRWVPYTDTSNPAAVIYTEPDTQGLVVVNEGAGVATVTIDDQTAVFGGQTYTSFLWTGSDPRTSGFVMAYTLTLPWFDLGDPTTTKIFEEIFLDVDPQLFATGVYPQAPTMAVDVMLDYSDTVVETISVVIPTGTSFTGRTLVSLLPQLLSRGGAWQSFGREARAISFRIYGNAYPTQPVFYRLLFKYQPTGPLTAGGTKDWTDLGYPHDKRLSTVRVLFDTQGINQSIVIDLMSGINGTTFTEGTVAAGTVLTLSNPVIDGNGRCSKTFSLPDGLIAKLVRVRPYATVPIIGQTASTLFRILDTSFEFASFPPDVVQFTEPKEFCPYEGIARSVTMKIDTGGVACGVELVGDGANVAALGPVTTTLDDWKRTLTPPINIIAKLWKLRLTPGGGGKAQLWPDWVVDVVPEPPALTVWSSYEQGFGYKGWKWIKAIWLMYISQSNLTVQLTSDTGTYSFTLPAHPTRAAERTYLPAVWGAGFNKSKVYDILITPQAGTFKCYADLSGFEWMAIGSDQHTAFQQMTLSELMKLAA